MTDRDDLGLFEGYGIEIEYMIVDRDSLSVLPITDRLLDDQSRDDGDIAWSNELALHVVELKTNGPVTSIPAQVAAFNRSRNKLLAELHPHGARLMPGAMHPWMDPHSEFRIWPHGDRVIYAALDRIFDCRGHGWANLQSMHVNLPFQGDDQLARLHAAIRLVLPLLPGLAASSPLMEGRATQWLDTRMLVYRDNCRRIPNITGAVIPESIHGYDSYQTTILEPMYAAIAPQDAEGTLQHEWLNARGAIARFDRNAIEIRVLDSQECVSADLAIAELAVATIRGLVEENWSSHATQFDWPLSSLVSLLEAGMKKAEQTEIHDAAYLRLFGFTRSSSTTLSRLWEQLANSATARGLLSDRAGYWVEHYLRHGCLARRILEAIKTDARRPAMQRVYGQLCNNLDNDDFFAPSP